MSIAFLEGAEYIVCEDCNTGYNQVDYWCCPTCRSSAIRHWGHEDDCPRRDDPDAADSCTCDIAYHAECCPDCKNGGVWVDYDDYDDYNGYSYLMND